MNGIKKRRSPVNKKHTTVEELTMADIVGILSKRRISNYESWISRFCLHNIDDRRLRIGLKLVKSRINMSRVNVNQCGLIWIMKVLGLDPFAFGVRRIIQSCSRRSKAVIFIVH